MKTAVIYARARNEICSQELIEQQIALCQQVANEKGMIVVKTYTDIEELGKPINRIALAQMLDDSITATWDSVIIYSTDRICRNRQQFEKIESTLEKHGKSLLVITAPDREYYKEIIRNLKKQMKQIRKKEKETK